MSRALTKTQSLNALRVLLLQHPEGIHYKDLLDATGYKHRATVYRHLSDIAARQLQGGLWTLDPTEDDVELACAILARADHQCDSQ